MTRKSEVGSTLSALGHEVLQVARKHSNIATPTSATKPVQGNMAESLTVRGRHEAIALEAWVCAEKRGFVAGDPFIDWLEAEKAVDARLAAMQGHRTAV